MTPTDETTAVEADAPGTPRGGQRFDLGVLLVHGIGESGRGETLAHWGRAIVEGLRAWLGPQRQVRVAAAQLQTDPHASQEPPSATVEISTDTDPSADTTRRWLFVEAWWARAFPEPGFRDLALWSLAVAPWTVVSHVDRRVRRTVYRFQQPSSLRQIVSNAWRAGVEIASLLVWLFLLPFLLLIVIVVAVLALVPGPLRAFAASVQRLLSAYLGDSYILVGNSVAGGAILERVRGDLDWLASRCDRVAVLAHSQGGAIAHSVLHANPTAQCDWLLTFGSGLQKLSEIERSARFPGARAPILAAILGAWIAAAGVALAILSSLWAGVGTAAVGLTVTLISTSVWHGRTARSLAAQQQRDQDRRIFDQEYRLPDTIEWTDVFASADLVPNGALLDDLLPGTMKSHTITNRGSTVFDHVTYWNNRDEFVSGVVRRLAVMSDLGPRTGAGTRSGPAAWAPAVDAGAVASARRSWRVTWAVLLRRLVIASVLLLLFRWRAQAPFVSGLVEVVHSWLASVPLVRDTLSAQPPAGLLNVSGVATLLALALAVHVPIHAMWLWWDAVESDRFVRGRGIRWWEWRGLVVTAVWVALCELVLRASGLVSGVVPASILVLAGLYGLWWWFRGLGLFGVVEGVTVIAAVASSERMAAIKQEAERHALEREIRAGNARARVRRGWLNQEQAQSPSLDEGQRRKRLEDAIADYETALDDGEPSAGVLLGGLLESKWRELREHRSSNGRAQAAGAAMARDSATGLSADELRQGALKAYDRGKDLGDPDCRVRLSRLLRDGGPQDQRQAEKALEQGGALGDADILLELGRVWLQRGKRTKAREALERAAARGATAALVDLGQLFSQQGDRASAARHLRLALDQGVRSAVVPLATLLVAEERFDEAVRVLREGMGLRVGQAGLRLGDLHRRLGRMAEARESYRRVFAGSFRRDEREDAALALARVHRGEGRFEQAERVLIAAEHRFDSARAAIERARFRLRRGDRDGARNALAAARALARMTDDRWSAELAASELARMLADRDPVEAVKTLGQAVTELGSSWLAMELGALEEKRGNVDAAVAAYELAAALSRSAQSSAQAELAAARLRESRRDAGAAAAEATESGDAIAVVHDRQTLDESRSAIASYRRALGTARRRGEIWSLDGIVTELADAYSRIGRIGRAERVLVAAVRTLRSAQVASALGRFRLECGDTDAAVSSYEHAAELARLQGLEWAISEAARALANLHVERGEASRAESVLASAVVHGTPDVAFALGELRAGRGNASGAIEAYGRALELAGTGDSDWLVGSAAGKLAELHAAQGDRPQAERLLSLAAWDFGDAGAAVALAELMIKHGRHEEAQEVYRKAFELAASSGDTYAADRAWRAMATSYREQGNHERAAEVYETAVAELRSSAAALELGRLWRDERDAVKAGAAFKLAVDLARSDTLSDVFQKAITARASWLADSGDVTEAEELLAHAAAELQSPAIGLELGRLRERQGSFDLARKAYATALDHAGKNPKFNRWVWIDLAAARLTLDEKSVNPTAADDLLRTTRERYGPDGLIELARSLGARARKPAVAALEQARNAAREVDDPKAGIQASVELGRIGSHDDDGETATAVLSQAMTVFPSAELARELGEAHERRQARDEAIAAYRLAIDMTRPDDPQRDFAPLRLAALYEQAEQSDEAVRVLSRAADQWRSAGAALELGRLHLRSSNAAEATAAWRTAIELAATDATARRTGAEAAVNLAREREAAGDLEAVETILADAVARFESIEAARELGRLRARHKADDRAIAAYLDGLRLAREQPHESQLATAIARELAALLEAHGQGDRAMKILWAAARDFKSPELLDEVPRPASRP